jgi:hypothetical protein
VEGETTIDLENLPGDPLELVERQDRLRDVARLTKATKGCAVLHRSPPTPAGRSIGVCVTPGPTAFTRMLWGAHSLAATFTSMLSAALDAQ